jgi:DNA polymerase III epsilon subunit-like protein
MIKEITVKYELDHDSYHDGVIHVLQSLDIDTFIDAIHNIREYMVKKEGDTQEQMKVIEEIRKEIFEITNRLMIR